MPYLTTAAADLPIIETCYSGLVTSGELGDAVDATICLARSTGRTLLLADCSALAAGGHSLTDLYFLADSLLGNDFGKTLREAVILPDLPASAEQVQFWETACYNRGITVRLFTDRASALEWLLCPRSGSPRLPS